MIYKFIETQTVVTVLVCLIFIYGLDLLVYFPKLEEEYFTVLLNATFSQAVSSVAYTWPFVLMFDLECVTCFF